MKTEALVIIDLLNDFVLPGAPLEVPGARAVIPVVRKEIDRSHAIGHPVLYLCDAHDPDDREFRKYGWPPHAVKGTRGAGVVEELKPSAGDLIIRKKAYSGFYGTTLDAALKRLGVVALRLTGFVTEICVLFTAADAVLRDYEVTVVENAVRGISRDDHDAAIRIMKNVLGVKIIRSEIEEKVREAA